MSAGPAGHVIARLAVAVAGGYVFSAAASSCLALALPIPRADAVLAGLLASFLLYAAFIVWAFAVRSLPRLLWGACAGTAVLTATALLLGAAAP